MLQRIVEFFIFFTVNTQVEMLHVQLIFFLNLLRFVSDWNTIKLFYNFLEEIWLFMAKVGSFVIWSQYTLYFAEK